MILLLVAALVAAPVGAAEAPAGTVTAAGSASAGQLVDRVAAVVNDEIVLLSEVYALGGPYIDEAVAAQGPAARAAAEREVLERLIERRLVAQEVETLGLDVTEQDIDRAIDDLARRNGMDRDQLRGELERQGFAWDDYRAELREQLRDMKFAQSVLRPRVTITDDELRDAFRRATADAPPVAEVQAVVLSLPSDGTEEQRAEVQARAQEVAEKARAGTPFDELARTYGEGPFAANGGEMGTFRKGELVGELDEAVFSTPVGDVAVVEMPSSVFVLRVKARAAPAAREFEEMREELTDASFQTRMEEEKERWYQQARRRAAIRVLLPGES